MLGILNLHGIKTLLDLWVDHSHWHFVASFCVSTRVSRQVDDIGLMWLINNVTMLVAPDFGELTLQERNGWMW